MTTMPPVAILCGGKGTRLGALTENTPKSLVRVAGRPFIEWQLELLKRAGVTRVVLLGGHLIDQLYRVCDELEDEFDMEIGCYPDGSEPLGQLGAVRASASRLGREFLVLYGDSYLPDFDFKDFVDRARGQSVMQARYEGVDYGVTYLSGSWQEAAAHCATMKQLGDMGSVYHLRDRFYEIGTPSSLAEVEWLLKDKDDFAARFLAEVSQVADLLDRQQINAVVEHLAMLRERQGRLFIIGNGGSAANASHAVNDFRKIAVIEAYAPTDNVAEFTARGNDDGWRTAFSGYLKSSNMTTRDALLVLSVGGGMDVAPATSVNIAYAVQEANRVGAVVLGVVGRDGGYTARHATACVLVPTVSETHITPHVESFQAVVWHLIVNHPRLRK